MVAEREATVPGSWGSARAFVVEHGQDDTIGLVVTVFSRPATLLSRLCGPVARWVRRLITDRHLRGLSQI